MKNRSLRFCIILVVSFFINQSQKLFAQKTDTLFYNFKQISNKQTPPELRNGFECCIQDKFGFIWLGSKNGLFRFDGKNYLAFHFIPGDANTIGGQWVQALRIDLKDNLWIGGDGWLSRMDVSTQTITTWKHEWIDTDGNISAWHREFVCDNHNPDLIWFPINSKKTIFGKFEVSKNEFSVIPLPEEYVNLKGYPTRYLELVQDSSGMLYQGRIGCVARMNPKSGEQKIYYSNIRERHFDLLLARANDAICINWDSLYVINSSGIKCSGNSNPVSKGGYQWNYGKITSTIKNLIPFCDEKIGLWFYDVDLNCFNYVKSININDSKFHQPDCNLYRDNQNRLWISASGIYLFDEALNNTKFLSGINELLAPYFGKDHSIYTYYWDESVKRLFVITDDTRQILKIDIANKSLEKISFPFQIKNGWVTDISKSERKRYLLFKINQYLIELNAQTNSLIITDLNSKFAEGKSVYNESTRIFNDSMHHYYWFGDSWGGTMCYDYANDKVKLFPFPSACPLNNFLNPGAVINDKVYFVSRNGFCSFDYSTSKFQLLKPDSIFHPKFSMILKDKDQSLWMTSNFGLFHFNPQTNHFKRIGIGDGLLIENINDIAWYADHQLLISYSDGIFIYNILEKTSNEIQLNLDIKNFATGIFENNNIVIEQNGKFWKSDLKKTPQLNFHPEFFITSVFEGRNELPISYYSDSTIEFKLNHDQNFITVNFAMLDYSYAENIRYEYLLKGIDKKWVSTNGNTQVILNNLQPGNYQLKLRAKSVDDKWIELKKNIQFFIAPAWWQTWWFRIAGLLFVGVGVYFFFRYRYTQKLQLQKLEFEKQQKILEERTRIASDLHDDIGSSLTKISLMSQVAERLSGEKQIQSLHKISNSSSDMVDKMNEIIWALNVKNDSLPNLISFIRKNIYELFENMPMVLEWNSPETIPDIPISGEMRRNIFLCVKEAVNNALKYSGAEKISITINNIENELSISITDNGCGFYFNEPAIRNDGTGNGLSNLKKRMKESGGVCEINSAQEKGTTVLLRAPLNYTKV